METMVNKNNILISVIVVVKNGENTITQCLDSLLAQDQPAEQYEVIVVDNGSRDRSGRRAGSLLPHRGWGQRQRRHANPDGYRARFGAG